ncbi:type III secretion system (T3SS) negative regulator GrlR [Nitrosospira sp. Nsp5]|uniref:T3SS negative regulator,GrlR n=1 Tax=Nitrosospira multiformis TaxID=1231 RepID=A0ABY0T718_9PROT|nr:MULTISPECIES: GrlR family regulatory protein [Nitrosospira]PTR06588.1 type III secretion system (T3SS) negative regulator GrlR [Nitrosospira sp. Nsp5]SDQ36971.1 T3SS negative regulator,GrlR [Nitrosospira multiformis]
MLEAMYGVEFSSDMGDMGYGVVILETGRIFGGDSSYIYVGGYAYENGLLKATVRVENDRKVLTSIFGNIDKFTLVGTVNMEENNKHQAFIMNGHMVENPAMKIAVKFTRRAELP